MKVFLFLQNNECRKLNFDLRPASIIKNFDLRRPIYRQLACYGHFGRPELDLPWERIDKAELLRKAVEEKNCPS